MREKSLSFNLEPTFRCNLQCEMCPRFSSEDPQLDMSMETYDRICAAMAYAHTVDFTGWGEPMLHPQIYEMISRARDRGCQTTMTSNATVLNEKNSKAIIEAGMQRLTASVDGVTPETFEAIRLGASFEKVTRSLTRLTELAQSEPGSLELGIAFTIQENNAHELELLVPWLKKVGARVLHLKQLNVISNFQDWQRSFLKYRLDPVSRNGITLERLEARVLRVKREAESEGIQVLVHSEVPLTPELRGRHCLATPLNSVYFSYEGKMAPCCHFGHHVSRYFQGQYSPPSSLFFGDIHSRSFLEIWNDPGFQVFREGFTSQEFPEACQTCYLLYGK